MWVHGVSVYLLLWYCVLWFPKMAGSICKRVMVILGYLGVNVAVCCR